jgi:hypothetical protein
LLELAFSTCTAAANSALGIEFPERAPLHRMN